MRGEARRPTSSRLFKLTYWHDVVQYTRWDVFTYKKDGPPEGRGPGPEERRHERRLRKRSRGSTSGTPIVTEERKSVK